MFVSVSSGFSQEIAVACPGQQQLSGCEEEESRGDGEGPERSRCYERAQPASQRGSGRSRGSVSDTRRSNSALSASVRTGRGGPWCGFGLKSSESSGNSD